MCAVAPRLWAIGDTVGRRRQHRWVFEAGVVCMPWWDRGIERNIGAAAGVAGVAAAAGVAGVAAAATAAAAAVRAAGVARRAATAAIVFRVAVVC